jgi:acyl-CoA reductase-like NAD-dependent aldehyde dehydrogenase
VILKPALETPVSCMVFVEILREAGLPPEWAMALPANIEVSERLATSDRIDFLSFIGSARVGWMLRSRVATGVRVALEHGGAAPVLVDAAADLDRALPLLLKGGYYHAGQVCVSVQRVFAHRDVKEELVERLAAGAGALRTGDPTLPDTEVGPLIRSTDVARVHDWVEEARRDGASVPVGGRALEHQSYAPTVIVDPPGGVRVRKEEVFGPVVTVNAFASLEEGVALANDVRWAFQAAVFTQDVDRALAAARGLRASAVMVNDHAAFRVDWMPFGGWGPSGLGVGGVRYSVRDLTREKLIVFRQRSF